jgi:hypothetical protein
MNTISAQRRDWLLQWARMGLLGSGNISLLIQDVLAAGYVSVPIGIQRLSGEVLINGQSATEGAPIKPGDVVRTGPGAQTIYVIGQDAFLQRGNSTVSFGTDAAKGFLRVVTGKLLSVFGQGEKTLLTPTATIGIRGTACYIEAEPTKVYFCLCYGSAELIPLADPGQATRITTRYHDHPLMIYKDDGMPAMVDAAVVNHTDAELSMLEFLMGRRPPFADSGSKSY